MAVEAVDLMASKGAAGLAAMRAASWDAVMGAVAVDKLDYSLVVGMVDRLELLAVVWSVASSVCASVGLLVDQTVVAEAAWKGDELVDEKDE